MGHYLALLYYLGCRPGEARGLMWQDIDWTTGLVHIVRDIDYKTNGTPGALKNKASDRHVPLPAPLRAILQPLRGLPDTYRPRSVGPRQAPIEVQRGPNLGQPDGRRRPGHHRPR